MSRISAGTLIVAVFAVLFGLVGAVSVRRYLNPPVRPQATEPARQQRLAVPLASSDLAPGRKITLGDIKIVQMSREEIKRSKLPEGYMICPQQIIGRILRNPLNGGEPFMTADLYAEGTGPSVTERLKAGYRAVSVPIENIGSVAGFAGPQDMVDVLFRTTADKTVAETTVTLLENVEVLAIGQRTQPGGLANERVQTVTLAVTAEQAAALKVVEARGEFSLALRSPDDGSLVAGSKQMTLKKLLGLGQPFTAEIYRAGSRQTITFENSQVVQEEIGGLPTPAAIPKVSLTKNETAAPAGRASN